ncbi:MAG TPA: PIN/TRAM domain-containing protein [Planctomycetaceae bacterium]|jgi:uncharacterized protein YacL|nr:PIN domain-containing protein [Pirellulales bacterium]HCP85833.1 PIN/TRAM domain-containing protein [Planctomycetaceae bacterium]|tara:strand:- start:321 stop:1340 length:1020 start_codon:yes stop_codon:yes gene_type:complete
MALWMLRGLFLAIAFGAGISMVTRPGEVQNEYTYATMLIIGAVGLVAVDVLIRRKSIEVISCVYFGIAIGMFLTYVIGVAIDPILTYSNVENKEQYRGILSLVLFISLCYICISFLLQTRHDFRFVIPYVEFSKEFKGIRPLVLDTSVIIDGRIAEMVSTNLFDGQLIVPQFVISELQSIADSSDKMKRTRGRRGLDILRQLQGDKSVDVVIHLRETEEMQSQPVDMKLVLLAQELNGKVVTGDFNLNKVADLNGVPVINLNEIANTLKPVYLPGENLEIRVVKVGEGDQQGVGYLDDGTMIVVEGARDHINETVRCSVTSVLQTSAGRMIFTAFEEVR